MPPLRYTLLSLRDLLVSFGPFILLTAGLLGLAYGWLNPNPPTRVVLATGPEQSAYDTFGQRYAAALSAYGITVELLRSDGSADNIELVRSGRADLGFVQGGSGHIRPDDADTLQTLGSLFVEPLWLFYHEASAQRLNRQPRLAALTELRGWRVNVGTDGSGVPQLFTQLLDANRLGPDDLTLSRLAQTPATVAFLAQDLDALVFASAPESPLVQMLLQTPGVRLMNVQQAQAYARRFGFLTPVVLPQGVVDLAANRPAQDLHLVASTTSLLARSGTHPAILQLFAQTAQTLHSPPGWFNRLREYPNLDLAEVPVAAEAERALKNGRPLMQRYLPFWLANLVERMWLALGLIIALALPLSRVLPPLYTFRIRSRVFRWYAELRDIETRAEAEAAAIDGLLHDLDALEARAEKIPLPLAYTDELYALRHHIELVRQRLRRLGNTHPANAPASAGYTPAGG
ncbi:TAXI family TRAP transporter solute-binding subunit [Aquabacterium sp. A08]|uniref:TAXI family TRAP transporter solute-binding subunit n=1 Tax=Aquabacterium sp. A08 TaxID=2718532 RepID=UPI0014240203|nr:TAXI family TRAP transporter solute-binding subunit [Aquabacterium sp. A08]NIC42547.1 ABC transporter substrate-binding protein [Aquabacterium sp. A08]